MSAQPVAVGDYPGIRIEYFEKPHRHYTLSGDLPTQYNTVGKVPSVTTILGVLHKEALPHWAAKVTREGCFELIRLQRTTNYLRRKWGNQYDAILAAVLDPEKSRQQVCTTLNVEPKDYASALRARGFVVPRTIEEFGAALREHKLTHYHSVHEAAERGVDVHQVWQDFNERQKIPNVAEYPKNRHGHIRAMSAAIMKLHPKAVETEMVVGSAKHGFAGRLDTVVVVEIEHGLCMIDVKTSKGIYPNSHFPQLAGYEIARLECGRPPTERQGILRLGADGSWELGWSNAEPEDFLTVLHTWQSQQKWEHHRD